MTKIDDDIKKFIIENNLGNDGKEKLKVYESALKSTPHDSNIYNNLGVFFIQFKKYQEAIKCFRQAIHINPNGFFC